VLQPKEKEKQFELHKQQLLNHFFFQTIKKKIQISQLPLLSGLGG